MDADIAERINTMSSDGIVLQDTRLDGRGSGVTVGIDLGIRGVALCISRKVKNVSKQRKIAAAQVTVLVEVSGIALVCQRVKERTEPVTRGTIDVDGIAFSVINGRSQVKGRA